MKKPKFPEYTEVQNALYAVIFPALAKYESRGSNAHSKAQGMIEVVADVMDEWIKRQERITSNPEDL